MGLTFYVSYIKTLMEARMKFILVVVIITVQLVSGGEKSVESIRRDFSFNKEVMNDVGPNEIINKTLSNIKYSTKVVGDVSKAAKEDPGYYTLKEEVRVEIKEIKEEREVRLPEYYNVDKGIGDALVSIERIINLGTKIWDMVVANRPVANIDTKFATALPMGVSGASELDGWSKPRTYLVSFYFENLYGIDVINVSYRVTYIYNGSYKGKGKYLGAVWAIAEKIEVMWGFWFDMQAYVPDVTIVNVGTNQNPVASLQLNVSWTASSVLKTIKGSDVFYIQGDGYIERIANSL